MTIKKILKAYHLETGTKLAFYEGLNDIITGWTQLICDLFALRALSPPPCTYILCISLCGFNSLCGWPFCTKGTIPTIMYLHLLHFILWVSIPCMAPYHSHVPPFTVFHCVGSIPCKADLFALRALSPPPCTYIHYISLEGCQFPECDPTTPMYLHSIPCMGDLFTLRALSPLPCTYIPFVSLYGLHSLHGWPLCTKDTIPTTMYLHSLRGFNFLCGSRVHCVPLESPLRNSYTTWYYF